MIMTPNKPFSIMYLECRLLKLHRMFNLYSETLLVMQIGQLGCFPLSIKVMEIPTKLLKYEFVTFFDFIFVTKFGIGKLPS